MIYPERRIHYAPYGRWSRTSLRPQDVDLLTDLVEARGGGRALGRELIALERQLR